MDPTSALEEFSKLASSYNMHLDERVDRDEGIQIHGNSAAVYRGRFYRDGFWEKVVSLCCLRRCMATRVAVKTIRSHPPRYMNLVKVWPIVFTLQLDLTAI